MSTLSDIARAAFEAYFSDSRRSRGANRLPNLDRLADGTYAADHTQRHWWTWQQSAKLHADELDRLTERVAELEKCERRLKAMMPLFEEARDALPAISLTAAKLHRVDLSLADRMDNVGDPAKWAALKSKHE